MRYTTWDQIIDIWENYRYLTEYHPQFTKLQALEYMRKPLHKLNSSERRKYRAKARKLKNHTIKYEKAHCYQLSRHLQAVINL